MPPTVTVFIQDACYKHQYIRSKEISHIVERPQRLRAVKAGLAAAIARLDSSPVPADAPSSATREQSKDATQDLADAISRLNISPPGTGLVHIAHSNASVDILDNPAVKFIHGDIDGDVYPQNLKKWVQESHDAIANGGSEIPTGLPQNDLYLCPESIQAIEGALGTVCEAVERVMGKAETTAKEDNSPHTKRAFVVIRPPGHHCGEDTPSGFCFVNNVAVGAAYAHLTHNVSRIVIFDIDLHHGNGTQSIVWQVNEETYRTTLESEGGNASATPGLRMYYGSIHDILSFPCEDGKADLIQAASTNIHGAHGQYIQNIHLEPYSDDTLLFDELYKTKYQALLTKAEQFLRETGGPGEDVLFFISCGMDACEHEYPSMSRHNRKVPTSFYHRFTQDAVSLSEKYANGKIVSVLEGGYSDRALISGSMAHLCGLAAPPAEIQEEWWTIGNIVKIEDALLIKKPRKRGGSLSPNADLVSPAEGWLDATAKIFTSMDANSPKSFTVNVPAPVPTMTLRERKKPMSSNSGSPPSRKSTPKNTPRPSLHTLPPEIRNGEGYLSAEDGAQDQRDTIPPIADTTKKVPRVVLKLGPRPPTG